MQPSILYTISSWSGSRSGVNFDDTYLEKHIKQLKKLKCNLTQISIGNPENPSKRNEFDEYIKSLTDVNGIPIVVHDLPNVGRSYGQWARIYDEYKTKFDYYIFIEDDYQPVLDNFDSVLVEMYDKKKCGFLCGLVLDQTGRYGIRAEKHAGVTNGIASSEALEKVREKFCCLPHDMGDYSNGQVLFSKGFLDVDLTLGEYIDTGEYRCLYYQHDESIRIYGPNKNAKDIFSPKQVVGRENQFEYVHFTEMDRPKPPRKSGKSRVIGRRR